MTTQLPKNNDRLRALMRDNGLDCATVGQLVNRSPKTIRNFRAIHGPQMPDHLLELLQLKVGESDQGAVA